MYFHARFWYRCVIAILIFHEPKKGGTSPVWLKICLTGPSYIQTAAQLVRYSMPKFGHCKQKSLLKWKDFLESP